jgi:NOL1/NOP2/fmu family ribosome biogenesis protein
MKILNHKERKIIQDKLTEQFGIKKVPNVLVKFGEEKIFAFSGNLTLLQKLQKLTRIEGIGSYIAKEQRGEIRLSIEGSHLFKSQITKNIFELDQEQKDLWMHGSEILLQDAKGGNIKGWALNNQKLKKGFVVMKYNDDFLGTGKASENKIGNFIPKIRRLKHVN